MSAPVYPVLSADTGVAALVGNRIFPAGMIPQEVTTFPVITYQTIGGAPENVQSGRAPVDMERIQIDCWDMTLVGAQACADAVRAALENIPALNALGAAALCSGFNGHDFELETRRYRASADYSFWTLR